MIKRIGSLCFFMVLCNIVIAQQKKVLLQTTANKAIEQGFVDSPKGQIHYWTAGEGPALLLIHQSSSSVEEYASLVPYLVGKYRLIAFDWPGHGNSDDPDHELGVEDYTESALTVLNHLKVEKCHVLGHHGGALIAMNLGYKHPEKVQKLILSGTSGLKKPEETKKFTQSLDLKKRNMLERDGQSISNAWGRYINYLPEATPQQILIPFLNNMITRMRPYDAHYGVLEWDRRPAVHSLKGPVLLMQGALDEFVSDQEKLLPILPQAERKVVENGGVFMFFDKAKECSKIILNFLEKPTDATQERHILYKRENLLVSNLERSLKIYRDLLGFTVFQISNSSKDSYSYPVFKIPKGANLRFATLSSPTQVRTLALTEVTGIELPKPQVPLMSAAVINVDNLDTIMKAIHAEGLEVTQPKIAQGTDFSFKEQAFIDFDGHLIVLYQILD